jgi:hypothetical protein
MKLCTPLLLLPLLLIAAGAGRNDRPGNGRPAQRGAVDQRVVHSPGFVEPHTPGSGTPQAAPAAPAIEALLGAPVDLNRVTSVRTTWQTPSQRRPKVVSLIDDFIRRVRRIPPGLR